MDPAKVREKLGLTEDDFSDDDLMEALLYGGFQPAVDPPDTGAADQAIAASAASIGNVVTIDVSTLEELRASARRADAVAKEMESTKRDNVITEAIKAGKMPPARRPHYERAWDADPIGTRKLIESLAANLVPVMASGYSGDVDGSDAQWDTEFAHIFPPNTRKAG